MHKINQFDSQPEFLVATYGQPTTEILWSCQELQMAESQHAVMTENL